MKTSALIAAVALACGSSAFAAQSDTKTEAGRTHSAMADKHAAPASGGVVEKTKNVFRRMGDKMRSAGNRISDKTKGASANSRVGDDAQSPDTRAMGATGPGREDQARRARMDEAYSNWQSKQK